MRLRIPDLSATGEALAVVAGFLVFGLGWAAALSPSTLARAAYPDPRMPEAPAQPTTIPPHPDRAPDVREWLIDGFNVLHAVVLGGQDRNAFWSAEGRERLLAELARGLPAAREPVGHAGPASPAELAPPSGAAAPSGVPAPPGLPLPSEPSDIWVVFDGPRPTPEGIPLPDGTPPGLRTVFAPSADEWLVARVKGAAEPGRIAVVTADRRLAARVRHAGARVVPPRTYLASRV